MTTVQLARVEQISPQSMGATVAGLGERGMVQRPPDPRHDPRTKPKVRIPIRPGSVPAGTRGLWCARRRRQQRARCSESCGPPGNDDEVSCMNGWIVHW
jgi:hypothetical protein